MDYIFDDAIGDYESYDEEQTERIDPESPRAEAPRDRRERSRDHGNRRSRNVFNRGFFTDMIGSIQDSIRDDIRKSMRDLAGAVRPTARQAESRGDESTDINM
ncbi:hypothetical protein Droror1_Dr00022493, partial [Drosera rotundifolia]